MYTAPHIHKIVDLPHLALILAMHSIEGRKEKKVTQKQLSELTGIDPKKLRLAENCKELFTPDELAKVVTALEINLYKRVPNQNHYLGDADLNRSLEMALDPNYSLGITFIDELVRIATVINHQTQATNSFTRQTMTETELASLSLIPAPKMVVSQLNNDMLISVWDSTVSTEERISFCKQTGLLPEKPLLSTTRMIQLGLNHRLQRQLAELIPAGINLNMIYNNRFLNWWGTRDTLQRTYFHYSKENDESQRVLIQLGHFLSNEVWTISPIAIHQRNQLPEGYINLHTLENLQNPIYEDAKQTCNELKGYTTITVPLKIFTDEIEVQLRKQRITRPTGQSLTITTNTSTKYPLPTDGMPYKWHTHYGQQELAERNEAIALELAKIGIHRSRYSQIITHQISRRTANTNAPNLPSPFYFVKDDKIESFTLLFNETGQSSKTVSQIISEQSNLYIVKQTAQTLKIAYITPEEKEWQERLKIRIAYYTSTPRPNIETLKKKFPHTDIESHLSAILDNKPTEYELANQVFSIQHELGNYAIQPPFVCHIVTQNKITQEIPLEHKPLIIYGDKNAYHGVSVQCQTFQDISILNSILTTEELIMERLSRPDNHQIHIAEIYRSDEIRPNAAKSLLEHPTAYTRAIGHIIYLYQNEQPIWSIAEENRYRKTKNNYTIHELSILTRRDTTSILDLVNNLWTQHKPHHQIKHDLIWFIVD